MRNKFFFLGLALAAITSPSATDAQAGLREGTKVRITSPAAPRVTGVIQSLTGDSIYLYAEPAGTRAGFSRSTVEKLEVSQGKTTAAGVKKGAIWGASIGAGFGAVILILGSSDPAFEEAGGVTASEVALYTFVEGVGIGALIGALVKAEKWDTIALRPTIGRSTNGLRLGFVIR